MAYILASTTIKAPTTMTENRSTQFAQHRTLDGTVSRDYFGDNKRVWDLKYKIIKKTDYDTILAIYNNYLNTCSAQTWEITEANYPVSQVYVHVDFVKRGFAVQGEDYLSEVELVLSEE